MRRLGRGPVCLAVGLVVAVPLVPDPATASSSSPFCAAVQVFNATYPSSKADSVAALRKLTAASLPGVKQDLKAIARAAASGDPAAVLVQASRTPTAQAAEVTVAGSAVSNTSVQLCHVAVNFLAAVPTGISKRTVNPVVWARTACENLSAWGKSLDASGSKLVTQASGVTTTLPEVRNQLSEFVGTAIIRTEQLITQLGDAGTPTVAQGRAFAAFIHDGLTQALAAFLQAQPVAEALPDDPHTFQVSAQALVQKLDNTGRQVEVLVRDGEVRIKAPALHKVLSTQTACNGIA